MFLGRQKIFALLTFCFFTVANGTTVFATTAELKSAAQAWNANATAALLTYGPIALWSFPEVTSLEEVFKGCGNFDEDLSSWNVSHVTIFKARLTASAARRTSTAPLF